MTKKQYLFRIKDEKLWKDFQKACIDQNQKVVDGLETAMTLYLGANNVGLTVCPKCQEIICECND